VHDCFEIVDVYKSQVHAYFNDLMQVTVLAVRVSEREVASKTLERTTVTELALDDESPDEAHSVASSGEQTNIVVKQPAVSTPPTKRQLSSSISISSESENCEPVLEANPSESKESIAKGSPAVKQVKVSTSSESSVDSSEESPQAQK